MGGGDRPQHCPKGWRYLALAMSHGGGVYSYSPNNVTLVGKVPNPNTVTFRRCLGPQHCHVGEGLRPNIVTYGKMHSPSTMEVHSSNIVRCRRARVHNYVRSLCFALPIYKSHIMASMNRKPSMNGGQVRTLHS